jgi:aryl carrier-like protein
MANFDLHSDEVVLYEGAVTSKNYKGALLLTLTSQKLILEREKGIFKKERELVEIIALDSVKIFNDVAQIKHKGDMVEIQTITANITLTLSGMLEARKFAGTMVDAITGTTLAQRSSEKIKGALGVVDDTLGIDIRGTIKGILENGVKGTILNGIGKKK